MATFDFSTLQAIPEQVGNLLFSVYPKYTEIEADTSLSYEGKNKAIDQLISKVIAELDRLQQVAQSEAEAIEKKARQILDGQPGDVQAQILAELKAERTWKRIHRKLDAFTEAFSLLRAVEAEIEKAGQDGDRFTLQVLREELPAYLAGKHTNAPQVHTWLDQAEVGLLTPEQREARQALAALEENYPRVQSSIDMARQAVSKKAFRIAVLPGWGDATLRLNW